MIAEPSKVMTSEKEISEISENIDGLLKLLTDRERFVIKKRFAIDNGERNTLEEIGGHFDVTRERVRQIERNALQKLKRNIHNFSIYDINDTAYQILTEHGGVLREDLLATKVFNIRQIFDVSIILFVLSLDKRIIRHTNTIKFHPYFHLETISGDLIHKVVNETEKILSEVNKVINFEDLRLRLNKNGIALDNLDNKSLQSLCRVYKNFKVVKDGIGLASWRHINPKTLRDKIICILSKKGKPTHFVDIANSIEEAVFDKKKVNLQAVHNELIRFESFVLVGRGIYALKEWGYSDGTVSDIIESLLKQHGEMSEQDIIEGVLKQREVKRITIVLNLKNKPLFIRTGRKRYALSA